MKIIKSDGYNVYFGVDSLRQLNTYLKKAKHSAIFILCDENTLKNCLTSLIITCPALSSAAVIELESGEQSKSLEVCGMIWETLLENGAQRDSLLINLGGGVVSDVGGFAASVYKRGISFINIPTSHLAMADASVGGKTAVDFKGIKNMIGSFSQPKAVFIQPDFLQTLPERHFTNGLIEIYKIALVSDKSFWRQLAKNPVEERIYMSVLLKNKIVLKDPKDEGRRKILNFGHTIGHALEAIHIHSADEVLHGEAVLAGMLMESHLSLQKKMISQKEYEEIVSVFRMGFKLTSIEDLKFDELRALMLNDKKTSGGKMRFSLLSGIGTCKTDVTVTEQQLKKAIIEYNFVTDD